MAIPKSGDGRGHLISKNYGTKYSIAHIIFDFQLHLFARLQGAFEEHRWYL